MIMARRDGKFMAWNITEEEKTRTILETVVYIDEISPGIQRNQHLQSNPNSRAQM